MNVHLEKDEPKLLRDRDVRAARLSQLQEPHVLPLTTFVRQLRGDLGRDARIPYIDPWDGGTEADLLYLLETPGPKAVLSGFISRNNPDDSAKNFFDLNRDAAIQRRRTVSWNIIPWYIEPGTKPLPSDFEAGLVALERLLGLLPKLRAVVLVGRTAERAAGTVSQARPELRVFRIPHPSPTFVNRRPQNRERIALALREVADFLDREAPCLTDVEQTG